MNALNTRRKQSIYVLRERESKRIKKERNVGEREKLNERKVEHRREIK